jgi:predicted XRE-type DNA-binding protein
MTVEAGKRITTAGLSRREIARRLGTSAPQLYRLLDPANSLKSINQLISLLHVLGCAVDLRVRRRRTAA